MGKSRFGDFLVDALLRSGLLFKTEVERFFKIACFKRSSRYFSRPW